MSRLDFPTFGRPTSAIAGGSLSDSLAIIASQLLRGLLDDLVGRLARRVVPVVAVHVRLVPDDVRLEPARLDVPRERLRLDLALLARELRLGFGRERLDDLIEHVRDAAAMDRRDRVGLLPAEGVELGRLELALRVVALVHRHEDRRLRAPEQLGRLLVRWGQARDRLDHEHDHVRLGDRDPRLVLDACLDRVARVDLEAAGVHEHEPPAVPVALAVQPITGRAGSVLDDRRALADDAVEQRAFADVRPPDDGDDRNGGGTAHGEL